MIVSCPKAVFHEIVVEAEKRGDERDVCRLDLAATHEKLDAANAVQPNPWPERAVWGAVVVLLTVLAVRK